MGLELFSLKGRVAWVTGGTKGLGLQMAHALASAGADVVVNSRHAAEAEAVAKEIAARHGVRALGRAGDVTREAEMVSLVQWATAQLGSVDILINNAGINIRNPTTEMALEDWQRVIDVNLTGPFLCSKAVIPGMRERGWGRIIHMSSMLGLIGLAGRPPYAASKGGLILLAKTQALELAATGVTVNAICPGPFATEMNKPLLEDPVKYAAFVAKIPMGRWGEMHEIEGAALFLASPASSYVTGTTLVVDGGWTAQ